MGCMGNIHPINMLLPELLFNSFAASFRASAGVRFFSLNALNRTFLATSSLAFGNSSWVMTSDRTRLSFA